MVVCYIAFHRYLVAALFERAGFGVSFGANQHVEAWIPPK
jgi:hypothetical protein